MSHWQKVNTNDLWEVVNELERRAETTRLSIGPDTAVLDREYLLGRRAGYLTSAALLTDELRRLGA